MISLLNFYYKNLKSPRDNQDLNGFDFNRLKIIFFLF